MLRMGSYRFLLNGVDSIFLACIKGTRQVYQGLMLRAREISKKDRSTILVFHISKYFHIVELVQKLIKERTYFLNQ